MRKVLVSGASGFIGSAVAAALVQRGSQVRVLVRDEARIARFPWRTEVEVHRGDLRRPETLEGCCAGVDAVVHCAGFAHNTRGGARRHAEINLGGTRRLLREALAASTPRLLYLSSSKASSASAGPYGASKREAEQMLLAEQTLGSIEVCCLRPAAVFGPGMKGNLAAWMRLIAKGVAPPLPPLDTRIDMIGRQDLVNAILAALETEAVWGRSWLLADGRPYTVKEIETRLRAALGRNPVRFHVPRGLLAAAATIGEVTGIGFGRSGYNTLFFDEFSGDTGFFAAAGLSPQQDFFTELPAILAAAAAEK